MALSTSCRSSSAALARHADVTKDSAKAATAYDYTDPALRGQVLTKSGERYAATDDADAPADTTADSTATTSADADPDNSAVMNADGSLNASKLIGLDVQSPEDKKVGDIGEVVLDKDGKVEGVVVDVGGFLGVGSHPVLLNWKDVTLAGSGNDVKANVSATVDSLKAMPVYERAGE